MYTQTTVRARNLRKGDAIVGRGETVTGTDTRRGVTVVHVRTGVLPYPASCVANYSLYLPPSEDVRVVREVRP